MGYDIFHPNQPKRGQIDEALCQFTDKSVLVIVMDPSGADSPEEIAQEIKESVTWAFKVREKNHAKRTSNLVGSDKELEPAPVDSQGP
jgi:hypothetical protein